MDVVLEAEHSHFYPGHEGWLDGDMPLPLAPAQDLRSRIAFADGVMTGGFLSGGAEGRWQLAVDPYVTAAGSRIGAKRWQLAFRQVAGGRIRFRIERKLAAPGQA
ncbi:MAG: hypothetical protein KDJ80_01585 [Nitratireductor sp.]|nr:hypothetical protein [Nitratireductor sp.]